ncbi:Wadjet anti-phage system protein JetD domain-containing protein [Stenotrophomonas sp. JC08]|uniref:Wadjet anti-phage system protein JetD domain-containing protein n=1 Tax=Stenotrophomonas sp. JC08 TaxID=3445779 RepID=UPI003FA286E1
MTALPGRADDTPARRVLLRLLRRAEAALLSGDPRAASLSMTGKRDGAEYLALRGAEDFDVFHGHIAVAERAGAIRVERDRHRDDGERLVRLAVHDIAALARELGLELHAQGVARAEALLAPWCCRSDVSRDDASVAIPGSDPLRSRSNSDEAATAPRFPVIAQVLAAWRAGRKVRGCGPAAAADLADAARAVQALLADARGERILRKASASLFADSKRLEALTPWLDLLVSGELAVSGLEDEQVWSALGLRREPQPLLLAGQGKVALDDGSFHILPARWLGFPVDAVSGISTAVRALLSIENLASFHEAAALRGDAPVLLLYTGGMPSPAWRNAYARLLDGLPATAALYHWGDIDLGGFRIAAKLAEQAGMRSRVLHPWMMAPDELPAEVIAAGEVPPPALLASMCDWACRAGWTELAAGLQRRPLKLEQERLTPRLP